MEARLPADEQRASRPFERRRQGIQIGRCRIGLQMECDQDAGVHVIIAPPPMRGAIARAIAAFWLAPCGPTFIVFFKPGVLHVRQQASFYLSIAPCGEDQAVLQGLMLFPFRALPAQGVG